MKNKIYAMLFIVVVVITGCSSAKAEETNTNMNNYAQISQNTLSQSSSSELKISDEIFDILERHLGFPLQENMQPISRKTWEYLISSDFTMHIGTDDTVNETFYENKNITNALEIHQTDENYKVSVTTLIFKSINYTEINLFREEIISIAEKKFKTNSQGGIEGFPRVFFSFAGTASRFFIYPIVKTNDGNYIFLLQAQ